MPKFAANLSFIFQEVEFLDRFAAAAACGFQAVEYLSPYEHPPEVIAEQLKRHGLVQALFNMPPGNWAAGERGTAALAGREQEFRDGIEQALGYAKATNCKLLHAMAGVLPAVRIEPINDRDIPGYFLNTTSQAMSVIERVGHSNLKLQLDLYHVQIMEGDLAHRVRNLAGHYPHVQIAGNPGRHEPDVGEINYPFLFDLFDELGYSGWIGCEYRPKGETRAGLGWAKRYGIQD